MNGGCIIMLIEPVLFIEMFWGYKIEKKTNNNGIMIVGKLIIFWPFLLIKSTTL